jgi:hypothetical protein
MTILLTILCTLFAIVLIAGVLSVILSPLHFSFRWTKDFCYELQLGYVMPFVWTSRYWFNLYKLEIDENEEIVDTMPVFQFWHTHKHYYISGEDFSKYSLEEDNEDEDFNKLLENARSTQRYYEEQL